MAPVRVGNVNMAPGQLTMAGKYGTPDWLRQEVKAPYIYILE